MLTAVNTTSKCFFEIMGVLREFFFVISHTFLRCLIKIPKYHNDKKKIMKVTVKSSESQVATPKCFFYVVQVL